MASFCFSLVLGWLKYWVASSISFRLAAKVLGGGIECPDGAQALSGAAAMPPNLAST